MNDSAVWAAIDKIKTEMQDHSVRIKVCESKQQDIGKRHDDICEQLRAFDRKWTEKFEMLIAEYHRGQGAKGLALWLPTLISMAVGLIAIYHSVK